MLTYREWRTRREESQKRWWRGPAQWSWAPNYIRQNSRQSLPPLYYPHLCANSIFQKWVLENPYQTNCQLMIPQPAIQLSEAPLNVNWVESGVKSGTTLTAYYLDDNEVIEGMDVIIKCDSERVSEDTTQKHSQSQEVPEMTPVRHKPREKHEYRVRK